MVKLLKNSISILMVGVLLLPQIVKLEHHHDHFVCNAKTEKHFHDHHEKCQVCSFEFSVFLTEDSSLLPEKPITQSAFNNPFGINTFSNSFAYSFQLRGPPVSI